jgi:hypothetical protein
MYVTAEPKIVNKTSAIVKNDMNEAKVVKRRTSEIEFSEQLRLLSGMSRKEPSECMYQWI